MTDADTARNLRWQREVDGDKNKLAAWKLEATGNAGLQFYAYMQPGEAFLVLGHSLSSIYSTTADVASYHGKIVLFTGDRTHTRECVPVFLLSPAALSWVKCPVVEDKTKLTEWYADNRSEYGKLCDPSPQDGARVENHVPKLIALPLRAVKLYQEFKGVVMPHELFAAIEQHLASETTFLDNGDDWGLIQNGSSWPPNRMMVVGTRQNASLSWHCARTPLSLMTPSSFVGLLTDSTHCLVDAPTL